MQRKDKVSRLPLRWRLRVADGLMAGDSYQELRAMLRELGARDDQLPSDHSFNVFKDTAEFMKLMEQEIERYELERRAAAAESMNDSMATVALGNTLKRLDWALSDGDLSIRETLETLRSLTQFHALKLATVRERRLWGDTEGEPPALLRSLAGGEPAGMGVPVPYGEMRGPVYPEVPLAESLLDLDGLTGAAGEGARDAIHAEATASNSKETEVSGAFPKQTEAAPAAAMPDAVVVSVPALATMQSEVPVGKAKETEVNGLTTRQTDPELTEATPVTVVSLAPTSATSQAEAVASNPKETEVSGTYPKERDLGGSQQTLYDPEPPTRAPMAEEPWVIIHPTNRNYIEMPATRPYSPSAVTDDPESPEPDRQRQWDDDDDVGIGMLVRIGRRE